MQVIEKVACARPLSVAAPLSGRGGLAVAQMVVARQRDAPGSIPLRHWLIAADILTHAMAQLHDSAHFHTGHGVHKARYSMSAVRRGKLQPFALQF